MLSTIAVIDDDYISQFTAKRFIEKYEVAAEVLTFPNCQEAYDFFAKQSAKSAPKAILLDLNMPVLDGWGFLEEFTKLPYLTSDIAVYVMTSSISERDINQSKTYSNVKGYFVKPLSKENLEQVKTATAGR